MKAVIYARYSSDSQTEQSIEGQMRVCKEYAEAHGYDIVKEYVDRAMTGTNDKRPAFQEMIYDSLNKEFSAVLVYKLDRFSRNKYEMNVYKYKLAQNGVKLISAMENIPDTPEGKILESLLEGMNEYYSLELSQKVKRGQKESRIKGQFTGGPTPYGYIVKDKKVFVDEEQANIVRYIFNEYINGKIIKEIVKDLSSKGIKNTYGKAWTINSISRVLRNPNYKGVVYADNTIYTNIYPAILSEDVFDEVNEKLQRGKRTAAHYKTSANYILSGKLICGCCGSLMTGDTAKNRFNTTYRYYKCFNRKKNKNNCNKKSISKDEIEDIVFTATQEFMQNIDLRSLAKSTTEIYNKSIEKDKVLISLEKQLSDNKKKLNNILKAVENGIFNDTTNERMKELEINIKEINKSIFEREQVKIPTINEDDVYRYFLSFKKLDLKLENAKQKLIDMFVNRVILFDDHCEIYFNISGDKGTKLSLSEKPDIENEIQFNIKKEQPQTKGWDCSLMAES